MPVVLAVCLFLVVALVLTSVGAFVWSRRRGDPMGDLVGLTAVVMAGLPAAAYGTMAGAL